MIHVHPARIATDHAGGGPDIDPHAGERALGIARQVLGQGRNDARTGLDQDDARISGVDPAEIVGQGLAGDLGDGARHLDAGRSSADDDEGEQTLPLGIITGELGPFECQ